jgi:NADH:ubiquinone oxidoreductase subunit E
MGTACYVKGSERLLEKFSDRLEVKVDGTTRDMKFTLKSARCIGCCGLAPAVMIDNVVYGRLSVGDVPKILDKYKGA